MVDYRNFLKDLPEEVRAPLQRAFEAFAEEFRAAPSPPATAEGLAWPAWAQKTDGRLERIETALGELAEAQARTEKRVEELAQAQARTEEQLARTGGQVERLAEMLQDTRREVGGLAHVVGYRLEDDAFRALPGLLRRDFGIELAERLRRKFVDLEDGTRIQVNIVGKGLREGEVVHIVGEAKAQLSRRDVTRFAQVLDPLRRTLKGELFPLVVTYMADPEVEEHARARGLKLYYSFEFDEVAP